MKPVISDDVNRDEVPLPIDAQTVPRFSGVRTFMRLPHVDGHPGAKFAFVGFPFDTATSYRTGARFGPEAIRSASVLLRRYHAGHRLDLFEIFPGIDCGDVPVAPGDIEQTYRQAADFLHSVIGQGLFPIVAGGDHSITLASLRALRARHDRPLSLIHLDAHSDTWESYFGQSYFHGTTFKRAAEEGLIDPATSLQAGMRGPMYGAGDIQSSLDLGFELLSTDQLRELGPERFAEFAKARVSHAPVFLSFDVDICDPAFAPGTGTPEIGGLSSSEAIAFLRALSGIDLVGADVVEVSPSYDSDGAITALLGANVCWELLCLAAVAERDRSSTESGRSNRE